MKLIERQEMRRRWRSVGWIGLDDIFEARMFFVENEEWMRTEFPKIMEGLEHMSDLALFVFFL